MAADHCADDGGRRTGPTLGVYLTRTWLPSKQVTLRPSTWDTYRRNIEFHIIPGLPPPWLTVTSTLSAETTEA